MPFLGTQFPGDAAVGVGHKILDADRRIPHPGSPVLRSSGNSSAVRRPRHAFDSLAVGAAAIDLMEVLDVGSGSGYGTAVLAARLGDSHVTSIDVDSYLTKAAAERLEGIGLRPQVVTCDATGPLPGTYDRIVATVSVRPIPASWLQALRS